MDEMKVHGAGYDQWEIKIGDKVVGEIKTFNGFRRKIKSVYVGGTDVQISEIRNQKEAIEKLQAFFERNKVRIQEYEQLIEELTIGITQVQHQVCINALSVERDALSKELEKLKALDLV